MSTRTQQPATSGGLSVTTLVIASIASICAALVVHKFWTGGAILGAGLTPIIVAIVSESLKKPTQRITAIREERRSRSTVPAAPPAPEREPERERPDPFGIWQGDQQRSSFHWVRGRALKVAVATGLVAFAVAAIAVTGAELVFGGSNGGLTYVPGNQGRESRDDEPTTTQPAETTETPPAEEQPVPTTPQQTTPEQVPTTPAPETPTPTPAPAPGTPPETPAPAPQTPAPTPAPQG